MFLPPEQYRALKSLEEGIERLGYRGDLLQRDYGFRDWYSGKEIIAALAAFGQTPVSYSTSCLAVAISNGLRDVELVGKFRSLGAPILFELREGTIVHWQVHKQTTAADQLGRFRPEDIPRIFAEHKEEWSPAKILRAKNIPSTMTRQMSFIDLGLVPALEEQIRQSLDPILKEALTAATQEYRPSAPRSLDEKQLFQAAFWLLAGKVFHDRQHEGFRDLSVDSDPDHILKRVASHYNEQIRPQSLNKAVRTTLQRAIWGNVDFRNLSVEVLAEIWSSTLVTPELRKKLGIHSTPRALVKYMVDRIPFEGIPEDARYVLEPCCGSARFLVAALQRLRSLLPHGMGPRERHQYFARMLSGYETDPFGIEISRLGLTLADYPNPNGWGLCQKNVFTSAAFEANLAQARVVLCNPPFENLNKAEKQLNRLQTPCQPAELLMRVLRFLHPEGVLGFVLPKSFLSGRSYRAVRALLVERFKDIELLSLPDRAFQYAQAETAILLAKSPGKHHGPSSVVHRKVNESGWDQFQIAHRFSQENSSTATVASAERSIAVCDLRPIWSRLDRLPTLCTIAEVHRGIEWNVPISCKKRNDSRGQEVAERHRARLVRDRRFDGSRLGIAPRESWDIFCKPEPRFLSVRTSDQRGNAFRRPWEAPKVFVNKTRRSRGNWRMSAFADDEGLVGYQTYIAIWPNRPDDLVLIAAILNSPLANAFVAAHEHGCNVTKETLEAIPIPTFDATAKAKIATEVKAYVRAVNAQEWDGAWNHLVTIDSIVVAAYGLPEDEERELLRHFRGSTRALPDGLAGREYSPLGLGEGVTLKEYVAITTKWDETNEKRCSLIDKKIENGLDETEGRELEYLQSLADKRIQLLAPLSTSRLDAALEALHG